MKKLVCLTLALTMLLGIFGTAAAEEAFMRYESDFSGGTDGWYARSAGEAAIQVTPEGTLRIEGRTAAWNSPGRDFALVPGRSYTFSALARQDDEASAGFIFSVAHSHLGLESYENLATATAKKGEWTELSGTYTPGEYDNFILYVETSGYGTLSFEIKDIKVADASAELEEARQGMPALKDVYGDKFLFGSCISGFQIRNAALAATALQQFNIITCENEMKPDSLLNIAQCRMLSAEDETAVAVQFNNAKPILDWAWANGLKVHGHCFVWHSQTPEAFFHEGYSTTKPLVSREVMLARLENFMSQTFAYLEENYPGMVVSYDVANEVIDDGNGKLRKSNWLTVVGDDYVARAFEIARKVAPENVKLYYNDYGTAGTFKLAGIRKLLVSLQEEGNIDGYGFQMHHSVGNPSMFNLQHAVEVVAATGLRMRVSELDVGIPSATDAYYRQQANYYKGVMDIILAHADQFDAVQVWGITDNFSWRSANSPLLFDAQVQPKFAFWALTDPSRIPKEE